MDEQSIMHRQFRVCPETEIITQYFYTWDYRLRGYDLYEYPIHPEPVFMPFYDVRAPQTPLVDDARRHTLLSKLTEYFKSRFSEGKATLPDTQEETELDLSPRLYVSGEEIVELQISLPKNCDYPAYLIATLFDGIRGYQHPISFEVIGTDTHILVQFSCIASDAQHFESQLNAFFPEAVITKQSNYLTDTWLATHGSATSIVDFGLQDECGLQLKTSGQVDPYISLMAALEMVSEGECALIQILFTPAKQEWRSELISSVTTPDGACLFSDAPQIKQATYDKASYPLFSVVIRAGAISTSTEKAHKLVQHIGRGLGQFDAIDGNRLIPLSNEYFPEPVHENDLLLRMTHRTGMLLSTTELIGLVHLPTKAIASKRLLRADLRTKECPRLVLGNDFVLGLNRHRELEKKMSLSEEQRMRHMYLVGASGTGKSTLLLNLITQDIQHGEGLALLDPHGDLVDAVLKRVPKDRMKDVIVFDPSDDEFPIGFNIFHAHTEAEKTLLASDLTKTFQRLSTSWGDRMNAILGNGIMAMLEHPEGGTLLTLRRFLTDKAYRTEFLSQITEPEVRYYWEKEYPQLSRGAEAPVLTRLDTFLRTKTVRNMVAQVKSSIDFSKVMDGKKILLVKLSHGAIGEENSYLLGTLIVTAIHQAALRRQRIEQTERAPFYLYIDEFQNFITPSMESILSGARKYNLGLVLAHQERRQLLSKDTEVANSVLSNPYTRLCFRLGDVDAAALAKGFSFFDSSDLQNLGIGQAIVRTEQSQYDFNLDIPSEVPVPDNTDLTQDIIAHCQNKYGQPKQEVETLIESFYRHQSDTRKPQTAPAEQPTLEAHEPPEEPKPRPAKEKPVIPTKAPGRGGTQHSYLQNLIKKYAEERGFKATIEAQILGGTRFVDVSLSLGNTKIACEISITNTVEYEFGNIQKCLASGYNYVVLVCDKKNKLSKLQKMVAEQLETTVVERVKFLEPDGFLSFLDELEASNQKQTKTVRGYKVSTNYVSTDASEQKAKGAAVAKLLAKFIQK